MPEAQAEKAQIVAVLLEHGPAGVINSREGWVACLCDAKLPLPSCFDNSGYALDPDEEDRVRAEHVADALLSLPPGPHPADHTPRAEQGGDQ